MLRRGSKKAAVALLNGRDVAHSSDLAALLLSWLSFIPRQTNHNCSCLCLFAEFNDRVENNGGMCIGYMRDILICFKWKSRITAQEFLLTLRDCGRTIVTGSVGLPVGGAEVSGSGSLDDDVLDISPCQKRTSEKEKQKIMRQTVKIWSTRYKYKDYNLTTDKEPRERIFDRKTPSPCVNLFTSSLSSSGCSEWINTAVRKWRMGRRVFFILKLKGPTSYPLSDL